MLQEPYQPTVRQEALSQTLTTLSAREQISLLLHSRRSLSGRDTAEVLGNAGLSFLKDRFLPILLHFFLKYLITGTIWWFLCIVAAFAVLFLLSLVEQISPHAVTPTVVAVGSCFGGFLISSLIDFLQNLLQFFRTTRSRDERKALFAQVEVQEYPEKVALLRSVSRALARKIPGESFFASLQVNLLLFALAILLSGLIIVAGRFFAGIDSAFSLLFVAGLSCVLGYLAPGIIKKRLH